MVMHQIGNLVEFSRLWSVTSLQVRQKDICEFLAEMDHLLRLGEGVVKKFLSGNTRNFQYMLESGPGGGL
jgi:hypothetical protein